MARWLVFTALFLAPTVASAQNASPTRPAQVNVIATGGFLGQMDGFCEQPGGTYDLRMLNQPGVQSCAGFDGTIQKGTWPVAMGGVLGARTWITRERYADAQANTRSLLLLTGNNQNPNFAFYDRQVIRPAMNYQGPPPPQTVKAGDTRVTQTLGRLERFLAGARGAQTGCCGPCR